MSRGTRWPTRIKPLLRSSIFMLESTLASCSAVPLDSLGDWLHWIRRNLNTEADALANWALDHDCDEVHVNWPAVRCFYDALACDATPQIRGYCDGASRGNPGKSSIGLALYMHVR
eukprot:1441291-Lingulodinium_polyedra.AAC.1